MSQETVPPRLIKSNIDQLTKLVKRPAVTEKVLSRPPFRFLFDLITGIIKGTGYLRGLYTEEEFVFDNVNSSRESKMVFLDKIIDAIGLINQKAVDVKSSKIVAGVEVEKTNRMLAAFARCVHEKKPFLEAVDKVRKGIKPPEALQGATKTSQPSSKGQTQNKNASQANKGGKNTTASKVSTKSKSTVSSKVAAKPSAVKEETLKKIDVNEKVMQTKEEEEEEEEKPRRPSTTTRTERRGSSSTESTLQGQIGDGHDHVEGNYEKDEETKVVTEPVPVRHNSLTNESDAKPALNNQAIDSITIDSSAELSSLSLNFTKESNEDHTSKNQDEVVINSNPALDTSDLVNDSFKPNHLESEITLNEDNLDDVLKNDKLLEDNSGLTNLRPFSRSSRASSKRSSARSNLSSASASEDVVNNSRLEDKPNSNEENELNTSSTNANENSNSIENMVRTNSSRPNDINSTKVDIETSVPKARPRAMTDVTSAKGQEVPVVAPRARSTRPVEGENKMASRMKSSKLAEEVPRRPISRLKSTRPTSSRPAPPRVMTASRSRLSHLMQQRMDQFGEVQTTSTPASTWMPPEKNDDDEDFVMSSQMLHETLLTTSNKEANKDNLTNVDSEKGRLVQQLLATKTELEGKIRSDDATGDKKNGEMSNTDGEQLRSNVQHLCQSINTLSKALNYLHEDVDPMLMELQRWNEEFRANVGIIAKMRSETQKELEPLKKELEALEHQVDSYEEMVRGTRATVARNQILITKMIESV